MAASQPVGNVRPISSLQKSMVLASIRTPRSGIYIVQEVCELAENVDFGLLRQAWRTVAQRHAALRAVIEFSGGNPTGLRAQEEPEISWQELDGKTELSVFLRQDRERGFDFQSGTPIRFALLRTSQNSCTLIWTSHHALLDGRSYLVVWREWLALYDGLLLEAAADDDGIGAEPQDGPEAEQFWRNYFEGVSQTTDYIVDRIHSGVLQPEDSASQSVSLSEESTRQLRDFARSHEISVNNVVQSAWALLLSRYSGRNDVVFGVTRAGRGAAREDADKVGFFINTLPLRIAVDPVAKLGPWLKQIRRQWEAMREFEQTPLDQVWKWSGLPPGMPPFESMMNYEHEPPGEALRKLGGRWRSRTFARLQRTDSPLTLAAYGSPVLKLDVIFDTRLFSHRAIAAAAGHLKTLLESCGAGWQPANACLSELQMLTADEQRLLLAEHTGPVISNPPALCAHQLFEQQAERTPRNVALDSNSCAISYEQLNQRANQLAWRLREEGAGPEDLIVVSMDPAAEAVLAILAVLKAGAAFVPIDSSLPEERLLTMLAGARPKLVLCKDSSEVSVSASGWPTLNVDRLQERLSAQLTTNLPSIAEPANAAYAIYTSGSSGKPKAVVATHRALVNHTLASASAYGIGETDRRLQFASIGSDMFVAEVFNYLCSGAALVFGYDRRNGSVRDFFRFLDERRITITGIPSAWWHEWVDAIGESAIAVPKSLRAVIIGMEKANPAAFLAWKKTIGKKIRLFNAYGPTETTLTTTVYEAGSSEWEAASFVPIGKPLANTRAHVLDGDGNPVPVGVLGQLYIGGQGVTRGYLNSPELTHQSFTPDRFSPDPADRLYRTGDIVFYLPDGNLVFVGRADRQVKIHGFRVELEEIESVLAAHPRVQQCAVVTAGKEGRKHLVAYFTARVEPSPSPEALRGFLLKRVPEYMLPAAFVLLPEMPMTAGGKIDRQALPPCDLEGVRPDVDFQPPSTATEKRLAAIWQEVLDLSRIGASDNFFELGADSLDTTRLITLIEAHFGREIPAALLWRAPSLARMASIIDGSGSLLQANHLSDAVVPLQPHGSRVPFFCLPGADENPYYFRELAQSLGHDQPFYVIRDPQPINQRGAYTVEQIADRFIAVIRSVQPSGPYIVGGHCYGGIVAFETARQLLARGEEVGRLVLFEAPTPGYPKVLRHWRTYCRQAISILRGEVSVTPAEARSHLSTLVRLCRRKAVVLGRRLSLWAGLKHVTGWIEKNYDPDTRPNTLAGLSYAPKSLGCDVIQFIAAGERHSTRILDDPRLGWREFTQAEFTVCETPGEAAAIFRKPHVRELAVRLRSLLDRVNAG